MKITICRYFVLAAIAISVFGCGKKKPDTPPDQKEVFNFFQKQMKQTATASGYLKYKLVINKLKQAAPAQKQVEDVGTVPVFPIKVDRTEYYDNYTGTYVTTFTDDEFDLYRDEQGDLAIADHNAGQTNTEQKGRGWQGGEY
jgi:predicted small lipoprotein YifL